MSSTKAAAPAVAEAPAGAPSRARPSRDAVVQGERQRRRRYSEDDEGVDFNLYVDKQNLDPSFQYRWVNDQRGRIKKLEGQDWELVSEDEAGVPVDRHGDIAHSERSEVRVRLMRKPKDWYLEDHSRKQKRNDENMMRAAKGEPMQEQGADVERGLTQSGSYLGKENSAQYGGGRISQE